MEQHQRSPGSEGGLDRRTLIRRGAVVGGAAVWATPIVQSLARPAFAAGSPVCVNTYRFKYEVDGAGFDNGLPAPDSQAAQCLPDGYADADPASGTGQIPGHGGSVQIVLSEDGRSAQILLPRGCVLLDGDAKAGGKGNQTAECEDAGFVGTDDSGRNVYAVSLDRRAISFIAGVVCCS